MKQQENMIYVRPVRKYTQNRNGSFSTNMILFSGELCQTREKRRKTKEKQESMDDSMQKQKS